MTGLRWKPSLGVILAASGSTLVTKQLHRLTDWELLLTLPGTILSLLGENMHPGQRQDVVCLPMN